MNQPNASTERALEELARLKAEMQQRGDSAGEALTILIQWVESLYAAIARAGMEVERRSEGGDPGRLELTDGPLVDERMALARAISAELCRLGVEFTGCGAADPPPESRTGALEPYVVEPAGVHRLYGELELERFRSRNRDLRAELAAAQEWARKARTWLERADPCPSCGLQGGADLVADAHPTNCQVGRLLRGEGATS